MKLLSEFIYVKAGFELVKKNLLLYIASVILWGFSAILFKIGETESTGLLSLFALFYSIFILAFELTVPFLLLQNIEKKKLVWSLAIKTVLVNLKRSIVPSVFIFLPVIFLTLFISNWIVNMIFGGSGSIIDPNYQQTKERYISDIIIYIVGVPLSFMSIFFSIVKQGILKAIMSSWRYSMHNKRILIVLVAISITDLIPKLVFGNQTLIQLLVSQFFSSFSYLLFSATTLVYYLKHKE